jgi:hypothetical protein
LKRRDFLAGTAGIVGTALPVIGSSQVKPCPPPTVSVKGGATVTTPCNSPASAAADWLARTSGSGVVWGQLFPNAGVVSKYVVSGNVSQAANYVTWNGSGGIMGQGCLEIYTPANDTGYTGSWVKPFSPIAGVDINNAGVAAIPDFSQMVSSGVWNNLNLGGFFAKAPGTNVIGSEFWLQYRVKYSPNRFNANMPYGKNINISLNYIGTPHQEIVSDCQTSYGGGWFMMYTNGGDAWNTALNDPQSPSGNTGDKIQNQPPYSSTCVIGQNQLGEGQGNCWCYPAGQWCTVMFHIKPGSQAVVNNLTPGNGNPYDQEVEVYVANSGQTSWSKIYSKSNLQFQFETLAENSNYTVLPAGYNCAQFNAYTGGPSEVAAPEAFYHDIDQIIVSTQMIPCPRV